MEDTENEAFLYSEFLLQHWMLLAFDKKQDRGRSY
jgi:hypothetical protein